MRPISRRTRAAILGLTVAAGAGGVALVTTAASAQGTKPAAVAITTDTTATSGTTAPAGQPPAGQTPAGQPQHDPSKGGHVGANGVTEVLLTGDDASKATAAALKAEPTGTIERVETDAEGAAYEAHMTLPDGSHVTVKMDANFTVTGTETGPGGAPGAIPPGA